MMALFGTEQFKNIMGELEKKSVQIEKWTIFIAKEQ